MVYLDLSFDGRRRANSAGLRQHGGLKGGQKQPLSAYFLEKSKEDGQRLGEDIDRVLNEDVRQAQGDTPCWAFDANKEISQSGETPLLINGFMASSKAELPPSYPHTPEHIQSRRTRRRPNSCRPAPRTGVTYHRPHRPHEFLTSPVCVNDTDPSDPCLKHGRPTRTTLLRARQKNRPVPVNAYEVRRQLLQRAEERSSLHEHVIYPKEILRMYTDTGDSIHSFLTGARYNRAHCLDAKILSLYGMYMSRDNPLGCFLTHSLTDILAALEADNTPQAPPDSPRSDFGDELAQYRRRLAATYTTRHQNQPSPPISDRFLTGFDEQFDTVTREQQVNTDNVITQEFTLWPDGLGAKSSRIPFPMNRGTCLEERTTILPTVHGVSMDKLKRMVWEDTLARSNIPPPPTPMCQSKANIDEVPITAATMPDSRFASGPADTEITTNFENGDKIDLEKRDSKTEPSILADLDNELPNQDKSASVHKKKKKKPVLVDRSVNAPSIPDDTNHLTDVSVLGTGVRGTHSPSDTGKGMEFVNQHGGKANSPGVVDSVVMAEDVICRTEIASAINKNQTGVPQPDKETDVSKTGEAKQFQEENDEDKQADNPISEGISVEVKFHSNSITSDVPISEIGLDVGSAMDNKSEIDRETLDSLPEQWKSGDESNHDHAKFYLTEGDDEDEHA